MNVIRPDVMKKFNLNNFDFSHNYSFFWDQFEKANLFLENIIATADRPITDRDVEFFFKSPVADGGVWNLFWDIAEKYGVVPQEVMPETEHSNNTSQMRGVLNELLRTGGWHLREMIRDPERSLSRPRPLPRRAADGIHLALQGCQRQSPDPEDHAAGVLQEYRPVRLQSGDLHHDHERPDPRVLQDL